MVCISALSLLLSLILLFLISYPWFWCLVSFIQFFLPCTIIHLSLKTCFICPPLVTFFLILGNVGLTFYNYLSTCCDLMSNVLIPVLQPYLSFYFNIPTVLSRPLKEKKFIQNCSSKIWKDVRHEHNIKMDLRVWWHELDSSGTNESNDWLMWKCYWSVWCNKTMEVWLDERLPASKKKYFSRGREYEKRQEQSRRWRHWCGIL